MLQVRQELDNFKAELDSDDDRFDETERLSLLTAIRSFYLVLQERLSQAQRLYGDFKESSKRKVTRQIRNLDEGSGMTEAQINTMVEQDPDALNKMIQQKVYGKASFKLQNAAQDITEKCEAIKRLQRNVRELVEMLKEISQIVFQQGEQINTIAEHVGKAKDYVTKGVENLGQAKKHHEAARCVGLLANVHHHHSLRCDSGGAVGSLHPDVYLKTSLTNYC